ncbi:unnamed protein product [Allacma fusca]|uniref:Uncharacterized protein n=1 Tax=Allacma fusca TaxID=39272 RepID=A0A8J2Q347_9HEXA|nr:unnamed protein product [Allacma fusca]
MGIRKFGESFLKKRRTEESNAPEELIAKVKMKTSLKRAKSVPMTVPLLGNPQFPNLFSSLSGKIPRDSLEQSKARIESNPHLHCWLLIYEKCRGGRRWGNFNGKNFSTWEDEKLIFTTSERQHFENFAKGSMGTFDPALNSTAQ